MYNDTSQIKKMLMVIFLGAFSVRVCAVLMGSNCRGVWQTARPLLSTPQVSDSITQLVLVATIVTLHFIWFLLLRPFEETKDAGPELCASIVDILTYAGGLALVVLARTSNGSSDPQTFLLISRAMLIFQGAGFAVYMLTQTSSVIWTFKDLLEARRLGKLAKRFRDVKGCPSYQQAVVKRFANRWLNRVLRRPLPGWPRLGPWTLEEQALVLALIEYYYQHTKGVDVDERLIRGLPSSLGYSFVWSIVGEAPVLGSLRLARRL